uniref:Uncharacterized protein n=1 Tax=Meloidogyne incognita TaxID=6306 RepID=A0A914LRB4_MELIC
MFGSAEKKFKDEKKIVIQQQKANAEKAAELEKQEADLMAEKEKLKKNKKQTSSYVHYQQGWAQSKKKFRNPQSATRNF